jgi:hypothetical protein
MQDESRKLSGVPSGVMSDPGRMSLIDLEKTTRWELGRPRQVADADLQRFRDYMSENFSAFGMQLDTPGHCPDAGAVPGGALRRERRL